LALTFYLALVDLMVVVAFALAAIILKALDGRGFLASVAVGFSILVGGGLSWFIIVAVFFTLGVAFTWYQYEYKRKMGSAQEKGGARNWPNILANGGMASIFAVANFLSAGPAFAVLFLGSISTSAADTVATELGLLSERTPTLITHPGKPVPPGTSGGVTSLGFAGALLASTVIGVMAMLMNVVAGGLPALAVSVVGGLVGASADSLMGATLQRRGFCTVCLKPTEALRHCGERTAVTGGVRFIENNIVNLVSTAVGAAASLALALSLSLV